MINSYTRARGTKSVYIFVFLLLINVCLLIYWHKMTSDDDDMTEIFKGYRSCDKKTKVGFLKTHKCASSSVQNILLRFGLKHDLNFVVPMQGNYLGDRRSYSRMMLFGTPWEMANMTYDIFCLHTIWNQTEVASTLGPGAVYITILRDPVSLFESAWGYGSMESMYRMDLETFASLPMDEKLTLPRTAFVRNQMLFDMGLSEGAMDQSTLVERKIQEAENNFHLVMIAERWEESIILLKDLLCWDFDELLNLKLNSRKKDKVEKLSDKAKEKLREYLSADYKLYDHFLKIFNRKVEDFGAKKMEQEMSVMRKANDNTKKKCGFHSVDNEKLRGENKFWGKDLVGYNISSSDKNCRTLAMSELAFIDLIRHHQLEKANKILGVTGEAGLPAAHLINAAGQLGPRPDIEKLKLLFVHN